MRKFRLCFLFNEEQFDMVIDFGGTWNEATQLGQHLARQLRVEFWFHEELQEDDLK